MSEDPLRLDAERMRRLGYEAVDMLVDLLASDVLPLRRGSPDELRARLAGRLEEGPRPFAEILAELQDDVLPFRSRGDHPGFFAFIPFSGTWPGALGDLVASACNIYAGSWMEAAGPTQLELEVVDQFRRWIGYPPGAAGLLVTGGSAANMTALACARETLAGVMAPDVVAYVSDQAHSSLARSARALGFRREQVRVLPSDEEHRLAPDVVAAAIEADHRAGRRPLVVSATAGTTNTGAVDPLRELAAVCRERGVWLHVDAAYGGFAVLTERGRRLLGGLGEADSVALDPHKWLHQPYECGCLLVREGRRLRDAFEIVPAYLEDAAVREGEVNLSDLGLQLTRNARALKLWLSLRYFGVDAFRRAIDRSLDVAEAGARRIEASPSLELLAPHPLSVLCFRRRFADTDDEDEVEHRNALLVAALEESGIGLVSSTRLRGRYAIRACVLSHTSDTQALDRVLDFLERAELDWGLARPPPPRRESAIDQTWARHPAIEPGSLASVPLFRGLPLDELERIARLGRVRRTAARERVVTQWDTSTELYVVLDGSVEVSVDGETVATPGPGDFFGELAAIEWGAGYGYSRSATVTSVGRGRLLVFTSEATEVLLRDYADIARRLREAARLRLAGR
jgi:aromatic-L-amino-acid/L-tryptophan decarboxylase